MSEWVPAGVYDAPRWATTFRCDLYERHAIMGSYELPSIEAAWAFWDRVTDMGRKPGVAIEIKKWRVGAWDATEQIAHAETLNGAACSCQGTAPNSYIEVDR